MVEERAGGGERGAGEVGIKKGRAWRRGAEEGGRVTRGRRRARAVGRNGRVASSREGGREAGRQGAGQAGKEVRRYERSVHEDVR